MTSGMYTRYKLEVFTFEVLLHGLFTWRKRRRYTMLATSEHAARRIIMDFLLNKGYKIKEILRYE